MFGKIKKDDIYICGSLVAQTRTTPIDEHDIFCKGINNSMFVYDLDNLILIKCGDYYVNLEAIEHYSEFKKIKNNDKYNNSYFKNKALSKETLQKIVDQDDHDFDNQFFVLKDSLLPYNDRFVTEYYPIDTSKNYLTWSEIKKVNSMCVVRRQGIDNFPHYSYGEHQPRSK